MDGRTPHAVLGVGPHATPTEIKRAYRARALATHPDHGGRRDDFEAVAAALGELRRQGALRPPDPFSAVLSSPAPSSWSRYDSPPRRTRYTTRPTRPRFEDLLRAELSRLDAAAAA